MQQLNFNINQKFRMPFRFEGQTQPMVELCRQFFLEKVRELICRNNEVVKLTARFQLPDNLTTSLRCGVLIISISCYRKPSDELKKQILAISAELSSDLSPLNMAEKNNRRLPKEQTLFDTPFPAMPETSMTGDRLQQLIDLFQQKQHIILQQVKEDAATAKKIVSRVGSRAAKHPFQKICGKRYLSVYQVAGMQYYIEARSNNRFSASISSDAIDLNALHSRRMSKHRDKDGRFNYDTAGSFKGMKHALRQNDNKAMVFLATHSNYSTVPDNVQNNLFSQAMIDRLLGRQAYSFTRKQSQHGSSRLYLMTECLGPNTLDGIMEKQAAALKHDPLSPAINYMPGNRRLLQQLLVLHSHNIIHGDLKLQNVVVSDLSNFNLVDFDSSLTAYKPSKSASGTPRWRSPDMQLNDDSKVNSFAFDYWSFMILLALQYPKLIRVTEIIFSTGLTAPKNTYHKTFWRQNQPKTGEVYALYSLLHSFTDYYPPEDFPIEEVNRRLHLANGTFLNLLIYNQALMSTQDLKRGYLQQLYCHGHNESVSQFKLVVSQSHALELTEKMLGLREKEEIISEISKLSEAITNYEPRQNLVKFEEKIAERSNLLESFPPIEAITQFLKKLKMTCYSYYENGNFPSPIQKQELTEGIFYLTECINTLNEKYTTGKLYLYSSEEAKMLEEPRGAFLSIQARFQIYLTSPSFCETLTEEHAKTIVNIGRRRFGVLIKLLNALPLNRLGIATESKQLIQHFILSRAIQYSANKRCDINHFLRGICFPKDEELYSDAITLIKKNPTDWAVIRFRMHTLKKIYFNEDSREAIRSMAWHDTNDTLLTLYDGILAEALAVDSEEDFDKLCTIAGELVSYGLPIAHQPIDISCTPLDRQFRRTMNSGDDLHAKGRLYRFWHHLALAMKTHEYFNHVDISATEINKIQTQLGHTLARPWNLSYLLLTPTSLASSKLMSLNHFPLLITLLNAIAKHYSQTYAELLLIKVDFAHLIRLTSRETIAMIENNEITSFDVSFKVKCSPLAEKIDQLLLYQEALPFLSKSSVKALTDKPGDQAVCSVVEAQFIRDILNSKALGEAIFFDAYHKLDCKTQLKLFFRRLSGDRLLAMAAIVKGLKQVAKRQQNTGNPRIITLTKFDLNSLLNTLSERSKAVALSDNSAALFATPKTERLSNTEKTGELPATMKRP